MHQFRPRLLAVLLVGVFQAAHRAGNARGAIADHGCPAVALPVGVEVHVARGGQRGALAEIDESGAAVGEADQHEAAAADVARAGMGDGERESHRDRRIDGVAAVLENLQPGLRWRGVRG